MLCLIGLVCTCCSTDSPIPVYSEVPKPRVIVEVEEPPDFIFSYPLGPDNDPSGLWYEQLDTGWIVMHKFPQLDNFEQMSNWWFRHGIASQYVSNEIYLKQR